MAEIGPQEACMSAVVDTLTDRKVLIVVSNPGTSRQTGWPIGFWWAELTHPYWEFTERGYRVDVASPDGGALEADPWSDPRDESGYSAEDLVTLGFVNSPDHVGWSRSPRHCLRCRPLTTMRCSWSAARA